MAADSRLRRHRSSRMHLRHQSRRRFLASDYRALITRLIRFSDLLIATVFVFITGCGGNSSNKSPNETEKITIYEGTWYQNGASGTQDAQKTLVINTDLSYAQTINQYETTSKLILSSIKVVTGAITAISIDENNSEYDTVFIDIIDVEITPKTLVQATEWNGDQYGGETDWTVDAPKTFNSSNSGDWEFGPIWLSNIAVSVKREGSLLNVNERGGFDGSDPPEDVYFLQ